MKNVRNHHTNCLRISTEWKSPELQKITRKIFMYTGSAESYLDTLIVGSGRRRLTAGVPGSVSKLGRRPIKNRKTSGDIDGLVSFHCVSVSWEFSTT